MIQDQLSLILSKNQKEQNKLFRRTLFKEVIQDYILNYIYNNPIYKELIFTGGTCLRKIYGLPRLSEDLDFDFKDNFDITRFSGDIKDYFTQKIQYQNLETKIANNKKTVLIKFPALIENSLVFVRCDFSRATGDYKTEINSISTGEFTFFLLSYDLPTLFANKIIAFLERQFFKGSKQNIPFKGRDLFDLVWFFEQSAKSGYKLQPNWGKIIQELKIKDKRSILQALLIKAKKIWKQENTGVYNDLLPFIESSETLEFFSNNFVSLLETGIKKIIIR